MTARQQLQRELVRKLSMTRNRLEQDKMRLKYLSPMNRLNENRRRAMDYEKKLIGHMQNLIRERRHTLSLLAGSLEVSFTALTQ